MINLKLLTRDDLIVFYKLLVENRDSAKLQKITNCDYLESIELKQKLDIIIN